MTAALSLTLTADATGVTATYATTGNEGTPATPATPGAPAVPETLEVVHTTEGPVTFDGALAHLSSTLTIPGTPEVPAVPSDPGSPAVAPLQEEFWKPTGTSLAFAVTGDPRVWKSPTGPADGRTVTVSGAGRVGGAAGQRVTATADVTIPVAPVDPPVDPPAPGFVKQFAGDRPPKMKFVGNSLDGVQTQAQFDDRMGTRSGAIRRYFQANEITSAVAFCTQMKAENRLPVISFKLPGSWRAVANGLHDAWATELCDRLSAIGIEIIVSWHHEPNGDGPAIDFTDMYDLCGYRIFAGYTEFLTLAPILNGYSFLPGGGDNPRQWVPKHALCKLVLLDHYNQWWTYDATLTKNFQGKPEDINGWRSSKTTLDMLRLIISWGYKTGLVEWGVHLAHQESGRSAGYITEMATGFYGDDLDDCLFILAFQSGENSPRGGWWWHLGFVVENRGDGAPKPIVTFLNNERVIAAQPLWARTVYPTTPIAA